MIIFPLMGVIGVTWLLEILGNKRYLENGAGNRYSHDGRL